MIFENRMDCPTFVFISIDGNGMEISPDTDVHLDIHDKAVRQTFVRDTISAGYFTEDGYYAKIKKQDFIVVEGIAAFDGLQRDGEEWIIPAGSNGVPYYWFRAMAPATDEKTFIPAKFSKEFSRVNVTFIIEDKEFPYDMTVIGNTCGIDISTGEPLAGPFRYEAPEGRRPGLFSFIVPRQRDNSLRLELTAKETTKASTEENIPANNTLYMWDLLKNISGFSWDMESLIDIDIEINYVLSTFTIDITEWDQSETYEFKM